MNLQSALPALRWQGLGPALSRRNAALAHRVRQASSCVAVACVASTAFAGDLPDAPPPAAVFAAEVRAQCGDGVDATRLEEALRVELSGQTAGVGGGPIARVSHCDMETGRLTLRIGDHDVAFDVSDVPGPARSRTLAVAIAETLRLPLSEIVDAAGASVSLPSRPSAPAAAQESKPRVPPVAAHPLEGGRTVDVEVDQARDRSQRLRVPLTLRAIGLGATTTLVGGGSAGVALPVAGVRAALGLAYLTAGDTSTLGGARLHAGCTEVATDLVAAHLGAQTHLLVGLGADFCVARVVVKSSWGVDEPTTNSWFSLGNVHTWLVTNVGPQWDLLTGLALSTDLRGVRFMAGAEPSLTLAGVGAELRLGVQL